MFSWIRSFFVSNPYYGMFRGWTANGYTVESPDGAYKLWTCSGFNYFKDHNSRYNLLFGVDRGTRRLVWKALKHDQRQDNLAKLEALKVEDVIRDAR